MRHPFKRLVGLFLLPGLFLIASGPLAGQAKKTATRGAEFDAFGGFSYVAPQYPYPSNNFGGTLGADYTQFIPRYHGLIIPSVEIRGTLAYGPVVHEKTFEAGFRLASTFRRLHPYADFLVGVGIINFDNPSVRSDGSLYKRDSGFIYVYGGGLTYDVGRNFSAMVDYQQQYWNLGQHPPVRFYPNAVTAGVVYHIPFKSFQGRLK